jgi:hypothetical protein
MTDRDDPRSSSNRPNGRSAPETPSEPDARSRRSAAAEGLSAIEDALLPARSREATRARESATPAREDATRARENVTPLPRPARTQLRSRQDPLPPQPRPNQEPLPPQPRPRQELPLPPQPRPKKDLPPPPAPRQTQKPRAVVEAPETVEEHVASRPARPPEAPIHRSDYRAPRAQEPGFLGAIVAISAMVAVLVGLAVAYFLLRKH